MSREFYIKRRVDEIGRFSIPKMYVEVLGLEKQERLAVSFENGKVILRKLYDVADYSNVLSVMKIDSNNRVLIPKQLRNSLSIVGESYLKLNLHNKSILISKLIDTKKCIVCGGNQDIKTNNGVAICSKCLSKFE